MPDILEPGTNEFELVEFWIKDYRGEGDIYTYIFGVNVAKVKEVVWLPEIIKVPNLPDAIVGVINLRGSVIPLVDLAGWMKVTDPPDLKRKSVIITEFYKVQIGFIVHEAKRIRRVTWDKIKPPPDVLVAQFGTKVTGVIEIDDGKFLLVLDLENVLAELGLISLPEELEVEKVPEDVKGPVLIADDSSVARKILKDIYEKAGFDELILVKDGAEAWNALQAFLKEAEAKGMDILDIVSLVVTDVEMPRMDGYTLARKIKEHPVLQKLPVIINTSLSEESNIERAEKVRADAFFVKFEPEELVKVSRELILRARKGELGGAPETNIPSSKYSNKQGGWVGQKDGNPVSEASRSDNGDSEKSEETTNSGEEEMMEERVENNGQQESQQTEAVEAQSQQGSAASDIDDLLKEFGIDPSELQDSGEEQKKEGGDEGAAVDDIDALIASVQQEQEAGEAQGGEASEEASDEEAPDIVDQILAELESGKMGAEGATNESGAYEVPTADKLTSRDDVEDIIRRLEERLENLTAEDEHLRVELIALIETLKKQIESKKQEEEKQVIAKLYRVTRETEEETVKLMEMIEKAMDITTECMGIADEVENQEVKDKLNGKLNELNDLLFSAINHLQFQDITRQKIERVIVALKKLNDYLNEWFGTDFIGD